MIHSSRIMTDFSTLLYIFLHLPHSPQKTSKLVAHGVAFSFISFSTFDRRSQSETQPSSVSCEIWFADSSGTEGGNRSEIYLSDSLTCIPELTKLGNILK